MPMIYILALEPSGDVLGAKLMEALRQESTTPVQFAGVGGTTMQSAGLERLFDPAELGILGILEVLPKLGLVLRRVHEVLSDIECVKPDILITIDSWGFTGRVHRELFKRNSQIKRLRYVAPQVWAWRPGRAKQLAEWIDHLLTLLPFEPPLFESHGLPTTWVGHPVVEGSFSGNDTRFRSAHGIDEKSTLISVLPGSRMAEVKSLTPIFSGVVERLASLIPSLEIAIPTVDVVEERVRRWSSSLPVKAHVVLGEVARDDAFAASRAALSASGTVTLELARASLPHAIAYKVNPVSAFIFRRLTEIRHVNLINVLENDTVVPECIQDQCSVNKIVETMSTLINDHDVRVTQKAAFISALRQLTPESYSPSQMAARVVLEVVSNKL